jgi:PIN domain nuclease of toxin-antitoxin system
MGKTVRYLLDTHTLLWWLFDAPELSPLARGLLAESQHTILVSSASAWEIATKFRLGRLPAAEPLVQDFSKWITRAGFSEIAVTSAHAVRAGMFSHPHRDPFDRMLCAQSAIENAPLITTDNVMREFGVTVIW